MHRNQSRLLLFDIDGTLLSTHGIPRQAMSTVLRRRYPDFNYDSGYNFSGRTDWEIVEHLLTYDDRPAGENQIHAILRDFAVELEYVLQNGRLPLVFPGVKSLLDKLNRMEDVYLGLVTGNIEKGARIKLNKADLADFFYVGGYGDDSKNRDDLPPLAISRAELFYHCSFEKKNVWIIGDSLFDIRCARNNEIHVLAVSTGWTGYEELSAASPDHVVRDFTQVDEIVGILTE